MKRYFILSLILLSGLVLECDRDSDSVNETDCTTTLCTMEFRSVTVVIKHKTDSTLYHLTDYKVNRVSDNLDVTPKHDNLNDYSGYYSVANDAKTDLFKFTSVEVEFTGYVNNLIVIRKSFIISADCCHIFLAEGETKFYI